jgi:hypothetical protein
MVARPRYSTQRSKMQSDSEMKQQPIKRRCAADRPSRTARGAQADYLAQTCIDHTVPLGSSPAPRPEVGPSAFNYFEAKHRRGEAGRFYPLHQLGAWTTKSYRASRED